MAKELPPLEVRPLTPDRWKDFETLFGANGACGGCWCMWWKMTSSEFETSKYEGNRKAQRALVRKGPPPGLLAYAGGEPVGWVAIEPRENYPRLERARTLRRIDELPVWSVTCFFVRKDLRRRGVTVELLKAAVRYAGQHGAQIVEGYPKQPRDGAPSPDAFVFTGLADAFLRAGFQEVARPSPSRLIVRYRINP